MSEKKNIYCLHGSIIHRSYNGIILPYTDMLPALRPYVLSNHVDYLLYFDSCSISLQDLIFHCLASGVQIAVIDVTFIIFMYIKNFKGVQNRASYILSFHQLCQQQNQVTLYYAINEALIKFISFDEIQDILDNRVVCVIKNNCHQQVPYKSKFIFDSKEQQLIDNQCNKVQPKQQHRFFSGLLDVSLLSQLHRINIQLCSYYANQSNQDNASYPLFLKQQVDLYKHDFPEFQFIEVVQNQHDQVVKLNNFCLFVSPQYKLSEQQSKVIYLNNEKLQKQGLTPALVPHAVYRHGQCVCQTLPNYSAANQDATRVGMQAFYTISDDIKGRNLNVVFDLQEMIGAKFCNFHQVYGNQQIRSQFEKLKQENQDPVYSVDKSMKNFASIFDTLRKLDQDDKLDAFVVVCVCTDFYTVMLPSKRYGQRPVFVNHCGMQIFYFGLMDFSLSYEDFTSHQFFEQNYNKNIAVLSFDPLNLTNFVRCDVMVTTRDRIQQHQKMKEFLMEYEFCQNGGISALLHAIIQLVINEDKQLIKVCKIE